MREDLWRQKAPSPQPSPPGEGAGGAHPSPLLQDSGLPMPPPKWPWRVNKCR